MYASPLQQCLTRVVTQETLWSSDVLTMNFMIQAERNLPRVVCNRRLLRRSRHGSRSLPLKCAALDCSPHEADAAAHQSTVGRGCSVPRQ